MADVTTHLDADDSAIRPGRTEQTAVSPDVTASLAYCHGIARKRARNFYYGLKLTPEPRRTALYTTYAFMRACDDLVDETPDRDVDTPPEELTAAQVEQSLSRIEQFRATMTRVLEGGALPDEQAATSVWPAFRHVAKRFRLKPEHLHAMLDGQRCDVETVTYETFDQLYDYCYKVASVVGLVCIDIWGHEGGAKAAKLAEYQGIAFQLTNIIRDVLEDAQRGRFYLPAEDFERFGYDPARILWREADEAFDRFMRFQVDRAIDYYDKSRELEPMIDPACRATNWAMVQIYRSLLEKIAADPRQVLHRRVRLSSARKATIAMRAGLRRSTAR